MSTYPRAGSLGARVRHAVVLGPERHVRTPWSLPVFASAVTLALVLVSITDHSPVMAAPTSSASSPVAPQALVATDAEIGAAARDEWKTIRLASSGIAPAAGTPDPGSAMAAALDMVAARGWDTAQYDCLVALWNKESRWNAFAHNPRSGAYGIPQALPGSKMASAGDDWATNPVTQITWGLGYIEARYGDPCGAWAHSQRVGWY